MEKESYIIINSADDSTHAIVNLTIDEFNFLNNIFNILNDNRNSSYAPSISIEKSKK